MVLSGQNEGVSCVEVCPPVVVGRWLPASKKNNPSRSQAGKYPN